MIVNRRNAFVAVLLLCFGCAGFGWGVRTYFVTRELPLHLIFLSGIAALSGGRLVGRVLWALPR